MNLMAKKRIRKVATGKEWYSWNSPVGLAIFFVALAFFIILVSNFT